MQYQRIFSTISALFFVVFCIFGLGVTSADPLIVSTSSGKVRGTYDITRGTRKIVQFLGIPYAEPPVGHLRFQCPRQPKPWNNIRAANKECSACIQQLTLLKRTSKTVAGAEDCLCLNVFTPKSSENYKFPVIVFLYGGAYQGGYPDKKSYGPSLLLDEDVVLVTLNFRSGILGFLSTGDEVLPGNYALKDQRLALSWVKNNIGNFGGDNSMVTLMGHSSGAACVHLHTMSPSSRGLFHRAIMHSGSAFSTWGYSTPGVSKQKAGVAARLLGCPAVPSRDLRDCLLRLPAETIVDINHKIVAWDIDPIVYFNPTIEPLNTSDSFLTTDPRVTPAVLVPLLAGFNTAEGAFKYLSMSLSNTVKEFDRWNDDFETLTPISLMYNWTSPKVSWVNRQIRKFYLGPGPITPEMRDGIIELFSDTWTNLGLLEAAQEHPGPTYLYNYDYYRNVSVCSTFIGNPKVLGPCHFDELMMFFPFSGLSPAKKLNDPDYLLSVKMVKTWVHFAKYGIPSISVENLAWLQIRSAALEYLKISNEKICMEKYPIRDRVKLWKTLPIRKSWGDYS